MMRDHVEERRVARAQDASTFAHRTADVHSGTGRTNNHIAQNNTAARKPLVKDACRKAGIAVLSFMLALTMMPSAGMAYAAENALGGVQR